ncbi:MAG TPA: DNA-processing protein DprA [Candidatus Tectomicrobia bacterium]|jgi:predicted Rossmann fold nucleotide-binding protein DprA/Smf involved in DNA uptake
MPLNITVIEPTSPDFPPALQNGALMAPPPCLWAIGNLRILETRLLGFFCSTRCPGNVILRAYDLALALREAGVPVIGGFHSPMEQECLDVLLRGQQPVVICPARSIARLRLPMAWRRPLAESRLLILSPFEAKHRRPTTDLAEHRNRLVATLAAASFVAYAAPGSRTERLCTDLVAQGRRVYTLALTENAQLMQGGAVGHTVHDLVASVQ